jgi:hypothetical protein
MRYRRADVTEGTYFFTVNLAGQTRTLLIGRRWVFKYGPLACT